MKHLGLAEEAASALQAIRAGDPTRLSCGLVEAMAQAEAEAARRDRLGVRSCDCGGALDADGECADCLRRAARADEMGDGE